MEIDFSETDVNVTLFLAIIVGIVALFLLGTLGRFVFPDRILTWSEWQLLNQRAAYQRQVLILQKQTDRLTYMANQEEIEPIHAQLVSEHLARKLTAITLSPLAASRQALLDTSQGIVDWTLGHPKEPVIVSQQRANQLILQASH